MSSPNSPTLSSHLLPDDINTLIGVKPLKLSKPGINPMPITLPPLKSHLQTFIILHGRGSTAHKFAPVLLSTVTTSNEILQAAFPHAKLIFLTASRSRAAIYKRSYTHQWFDHWHIHEGHLRQELMGPGLRASCYYIHGILTHEIHLLGSKNVILWGLSQGCATSLMALLTWDGDPFAAMVGMCGYLPFSNQIEDIIIQKHNQCDGDDDDDLFSNSGDEGDNDGGDDIFERFTSPSPAQDLPTQALAYLRDELDLEGPPSTIYRSIPVFLGHGTEDEKVSIDIGREAHRCMVLLDADVQMVEYVGLGHWYSPEMLEDIFSFLKERLSRGETD